MKHFLKLAAAAGLIAAAAMTLAPFVPLHVVAVPFAIGCAAIVGLSIAADVRDARKLERG